MEEGMTQEQYNQAIKQQQQTQIDNDPNALYADSMREERVANVLAQLDPSNLVDEIEHELRGEKFNKSTQEWSPISKDGSKVPDILIGRYVSFLGSILTLHTTISNYSLSEINNRMRLIISYLKRDMSNHAEDYGLENNYTERDRIGMIILETTSSAFRRALDGSESRRMWGALKVDASLNPATKKGVVDALKFW
jgi:hypothetical protein